MEVGLEKSGTVVLTGDVFHVKENYELGRPQGHIMRTFTYWHRSRRFIRHLVRRENAKVVLGHDQEYFDAFTKGSDYK